MKIDKKIIDEYKHYGVTLVKNIIHHSWIEKLIIGVDKNFNNPSRYKCVYEKDENNEIFYDDYCNWQRIDEYKDFLFNSNIAKLASILMQSKTWEQFQKDMLLIII